jgi:hypothetical protein
VSGRRRTLDGAAVARAARHARQPMDTRKALANATHECVRAHVKRSVSHERAHGWYAAALRRLSEDTRVTAVWQRKRTQASVVTRCSASGDDALFCANAA